MAGASTNGCVNGYAHSSSASLRSLASLLVCLRFIWLIKQSLAGLDCIANGLLDLVTLFLLAKKLFANEEHSNTEPVSLYILMVPVAGANLFAVLDGIAAQGHSRAVAVAVLHLVAGQALLY